MFVEVILCKKALTLNKTFYYKVTDKEQYSKLSYGSVVEIEFNNQLVEAYIIKMYDSLIVDFEVKDIVSVKCYDFISENLKEVLRLLRKEQFISHHDMLSKIPRSEQYDKTERLLLVNNIDVKLTNKQQNIISYIKDKKISESHIKKNLKVSKKDIDIMIENNILEAKTKPLDLNYKYYISSELKELPVTRIVCNNYNLLKTNTYLYDYENYNCLVVVDDIYYYLKNYKDAVFLSTQLSNDQYNYNRQLLTEKKYTTIFITYEQLYLNLPNFEHLIITNEQNFTNILDPIYSQMIDCYFKQLNCTVTYLASSPSISTMAKCDYGLINFTDLCPDKLNNIVYEQETIKDNLFSTEQLMLINKNYEQNVTTLLIYYGDDYAKEYKCLNCGYLKKCPNCNIALSYETNGTHCKYCGHKEKLNYRCDICNHEMIKSGYGLKKAYEYLKQRYTDVEILTSKQSALKHKQIISKMNSRTIVLLESKSSHLIQQLNANSAILYNINSFYFNNDITKYEMLQSILRDLAHVQELIVVKNDDVKIETSYRDYFDKQMQKRKLLKLQPYYNLVLVTLTSKKETTNVEMFALINRKLNKNVVVNSYIPLINKIGDYYKFNIIIKYKKEPIISILKKCTIEFNKEIKIDVKNKIMSTNNI